MYRDNDNVSTTQHSMTSGGQAPYGTSAGGAYDSGRPYGRDNQPPPQGGMAPRDNRGQESRYCCLRDSARYLLCRLESRFPLHRPGYELAVPEVIRPIVRPNSRSFGDGVPILDLDTLRHDGDPE